MRYRQRKARAFYVLRAPWDFRKGMNSAVIRRNGSGGVSWNHNAKDLDSYVKTLAI